MRLLFLGAGAIGTYVGGSLAAAGHQVTYSEQPEAAATIAADGLRLTRAATIYSPGAVRPCLSCCGSSRSFRFSSSPR